MIGFRNSGKKTDAADPDRRPTGSDLAPGCLFAMVSTLITCLLLFVNGGLVSAISTALVRSGSVALRDPGINQFVLFVGPVLLVIIEWMMIDYVLNRFRRS